LAKTNPHELVTKRYHENAKLLVPHFEAFVGRAAIEKYYVERNKLNPNNEFDLSFHVEEAHEAGEVGFVEGRFELKKTSDNSTVDTGKFLTILKNVGNDWQIFRLIFNTNRPLAK